MKARTINVRQLSATEFRVESFVNTLDLSVGQTVSREKLQQWNVFPSVRINVIGKVEDENDKEQRLK